MSHLGHWGRGMFPSSSTNIVSHKWQCTKRTWRADWLEALPGNPSMRHTNSISCQGKDIQYVWVSIRGGGGGGSHQVPLPPSAMNLAVIHHQPCHEVRLTVRAEELLEPVGSYASGHPLPFKVHRPPRNALQWINRSDRPYSPSSLHLCVGQIGQNYLSGCQTTFEFLTPALTQDGFHTRRSRLPYVTCIG